MSTRTRIPALVGVACAAVLLSGCSSSGTIGSGSTSGGTGGTTGGTSGGTGGGTTDSGCSQAMVAIQNAEKAQNSANAQAALQGLGTSIGQLRAAALSTQKPGGKDAMNTVADDLQNILTQVKNGQTPDTQQALTDAQAVATICGV